ncbi:response regulator transcription factor [Sphaerisporangium sp. NPDC051011]|uniref:response regulator transcription factor n=1 Tax=Sphaerisporangium sp. NPDC051011 TaxID=3155792 RepID=UPI00340644BF
MIRVLIADDQPLVRAGLAALLNTEPDIDVVGIAADGDEALRLAAELRPDVACLDIRMPRRDGIRVAQALCGAEAVEPIPVLVLTTFDLDEYVFGALEAGVSGFLLKDADAEQIVGAVRSVSRGQGVIDTMLTRRVIREFAERRRLQPVTADRADSLLTAREGEILLLLAQGMSNEEIAAESHVEVSTVKSHLARMLPKIGVRSRLQAVVWAYQNRIVRVPDSDNPAPASKDARP